MDIEMELSQVIIRETTDEQIIVLKERGGQRSFPIVIGTMEAVAINRRLNGVVIPRPQTHDLLFNILEQLDCQLERIVINDLRDQTFYAQLVIKKGVDLVEVDSRPSDAIALGVANNTPIFVAEHVLEAVC